MQLHFLIIPEFRFNSLPNMTTSAIADPNCPFVAEGPVRYEPGEYLPAMIPPFSPKSGNLQSPLPEVFDYEDRNEINRQSTSFCCPLSAQALGPLPKNKSKE
jgi:hypothetical protein